MGHDVHACRHDGRLWKAPLGEPATPAGLPAGHHALQLRLRDMVPRLVWLPLLAAERLPQSVETLIPAGAFPGLVLRRLRHRDDVFVGRPLLLRSFRSRPQSLLTAASLSARGTGTLAH